MRYRDSETQQLMRLGMSGDKHAQLACIATEYENTEGVLSPTCLQWLEELVKEDWPNTRMLYIQQALVGNIENPDWVKLEQWAIAEEATNPGLSFYQRSCMYNPMYGIFNDYGEMIALLKKGAEHKYPLCCQQLADYYWYEDEEEHSPEEVRDLLLGCCSEKEMSAEMLGTLADVCEEMEDMEAAVKYLRLWMKADDKDSLPCMRMAVLYRKGIGVRKNAELALKYFQKAANLGNIDGLFSVGMMYFTGEGMRRNYKRALDYFSRAAASNHPEACGYLAYMYTEGLGVNVDNAQALLWLEKGVERQDLHSITMMAERCYFGIGVEQDIQTGLELLERARVLQANENLPTVDLPALEARCVEAEYPIHSEKQDSPDEEDSTENDLFDEEDDELTDDEAESGEPDRFAVEVLSSLEEDPTNWDTLIALQAALEMDCFDKEQGKRVVKILRDHADESAEICITLGDIYYHGYATRRNYASSMLFYTKALEMDAAHPDAFLGIILGLHEEQFKGGREAVPEWLEKMQASGVEEPVAHYLLALLHSTGLYLPEDKTLAEQHLAASEDMADNFEEDLRYWQSGGKTLRECLE